MMMSRSCSQSGSNGHNSRTCVPSADSAGAGDVSGEIMLFGVRVKVDPMRKSVSMNNLSQYELPHLDHSSTTADVPAVAAAGYASADDAAHPQSRERKRGVPWTEDEHKLFLVGLQKVGKGDWRGISRNFVKTRTPTQVASHAQKYFLRKSNLNRRRRRSSLFDITTDSVTAIPMAEEVVCEDEMKQPLMMQSTETPNNGGFPVTPYPMSVGSAVFPIQTESPLENLSVGNAGQVDNASLLFLRPVSVIPVSRSPSPREYVTSSHKLTMDDPTLSLSLSLSFNHQNQMSSRYSAFSGDGMISVV